MKYGDTLRQRSIPEWGHFNIDYDYLKDLIKNQTTPGAGKALSIPGQGETTEKAFGETFFRVLKSQHDRINLFIKSKSGEIERRLDHISRQLLQLQARQAPGARLPARTIEKYAKIDADVTRAGEEIRSLSRFRVAQRTGFHKILKKYKRWTKDRDLEYRFREQIIENQDSFFQLDLGYLLDQYIEVLSALRAPFDGPRIASTPAEAERRSSFFNRDDAKAPSRLARAVEEGSELDFDISLATIPFSAQGSKATYWIHPDHIVEVEVLLLQHMRLYAASKSSQTPQDTPVRPSPVRRKSSATSDKYFGVEEGVGSIFLDHPETFAIKQNTSTVGSNEEGTGTPSVRAAGNARWTASGDAAVVVSLQPEDSGKLCSGRLKRKHLRSFLESPSSSMPLENPAEAGSVDGTQDASTDGTAAVKEWLSKHTEVRPIAGVIAKRTRLVGLHNSTTGGLWATLDQHIFMKDTLHCDLDGKDWISEARVGSIAFPHAILEVRREGNQSLELINLLDRSHLLTRVRGFSLETHAVWACCRPEAMSAPLWMPLLDEDIRKLPAPVKRQRRNVSSRSGSVSQMSPQTETSATSPSATDGHTSPYTLRNGESSVTSGPEALQPPPLHAFRKKSRKPFSEYPPPVQAEEPPRTQGYWNEYDNPEDEDGGYYIYIDPNATIKFPGQEVLENWTRKTKSFFRGSKTTDEESPLLTAAEDGTSDDDDADDTGDETTTSTRLVKNYGAIAKSRTSNQKAGEGYFSGLFRTLRDPHRDAEALNTMRRHSERERQSLLTEIHIRQHEREMTKLRFYVTCLAAALVIDVILSTLTVTSRRKERGVVDGAILFGTISNLLLLIVAVLSMRTRHERLGWMHHTLVYLVSVVVVTIDVLLLRWVLSP